MTARTKLKDYWQRTTVVTGPDYRQLPLALQKVFAGMRLTYRTTELAIIGGDMPVDENGRPARMDAARVLSLDFPLSQEEFTELRENILSELGRSEPDAFKERVCQRVRLEN